MKPPIPPHVPEKAKFQTEIKERPRPPAPVEDWHHLTHKTTGEEQTVFSLDGIDIDNWNKVKLARRPKPDEEIVDGKIKVKHADKIKKERGASTIAHLTLDQLEAIIDARIAAAIG